MLLKHKQTNFYVNQIRFLFSTGKYRMREIAKDGSYMFTHKDNTSHVNSTVIHIISCKNALRSIQLRTSPSP